MIVIKFQMTNFELFSLGNKKENPKILNNEII